MEDIYTRAYNYVTAKLVDAFNNHLKCMHGKLSCEVTGYEVQDKLVGMTVWFDNGRKTGVRVHQPHLLAFNFEDPRLAISVIKNGLCVLTPSPELGYDNDPQKLVMPEELVSEILRVRSFMGFPTFLQSNS